MNAPTERAMEFFEKDSEAAMMLKQMLESGKPARAIAENLREYMKELNQFELVAIYLALEVPVLDATDFDEIANRALCDWYGAHSDYNL